MMCVPFLSSLPLIPFLSSLFPLPFFSRPFSLFPPTTIQNPDGEEADQWREVFRKMCDYLLVALADPYVNEFAVPIVRIFIMELQLGSDLFQDGGLAFTGM